MRIMRFLRDFSLPFLGFAVILVTWQFGVEISHIPGYVLPLPMVIVSRFWETRQLQLYHLGATGLTTLGGLSLALVVGIFMALAVVYVRPLKAMIMPVLAALNSIPKIAIAPLLVIWFGLGAESKVILAFLLAVFPIFVNSVTGLGEIDPDIIDLSRLCGGTPWRIFVKVRLINALPYIADALRVAFPLALVGSIVGEFIAGNRGAGYLVLSAQFNVDTPLVFAALISITIFAMAGIGFIALFERLFLTWRPSARKEQSENGATAYV
jgi:NitT/TauT family transport system permease protein